MVGSVLIKARSVGGGGESRGEGGGPLSIHSIGNQVLSFWLGHSCCSQGWLSPCGTGLRCLGDQLQGNHEHLSIPSPPLPFIVAKVRQDIVEDKTRTRQLKCGNRGFVRAVISIFEDG